MKSESPMKKTVTIKDSDLAEGIRQHLAREDVSFSDYVSQLIGQDIISRLQYRLIGFYDDGSTHVETEFYTALDFSRSVKAYKAVMCDPYLSTLGSGTKLIGHAGKTTRIVIPTLYYNASVNVHTQGQGASFICTDMKGELVERFGFHSEAHGHLHHLPG